jgi:GT2 family glycosyltransferase/glycosyltransferase involved in cell wall biosynthesis
MPPVTIVLHVAAPVGATLRCLEAIEACTPPELYDVVIVDDAAPTETAELLAALEGDVRVVRQDHRRGAAASFDAGTALTSARWVALLGTDVLVTPGWLERLLDATEADAAIAAVQPKVVAPDGTLLDAGGFLLRDGGVRPYGSGSRLEDPMFDCVRDVTALTGGCTLLRAASLAEAGGIPTGYEAPVWAATDLAQALLAAGERVVLEPGAVVQRTAVDDPRSSATDRALLSQRWPVAVAAAPDARLDRLDGTDWWALPQAPHGKRILVIDPWSPTFDRDTGHKRLLQMLDRLRSQGHGVVYYAELAKDRPRYGAMLAARGIPLYGRDPARPLEYNEDPVLRAGHAPLLDHVLERFRVDTVLFSFFSTAEKYAALVRRAAPGTEVIVDSVDIHFLRERRMAEVRDDAGLLVQAEQTKRREIATYRSADRVFCVSPDDAEVLRKEAPELDIAIVPVVYEDVEQGPGWAGRDRIVFIASSAHIPNLDAVVWWREEIGPRLEARLPGVPLTVIGYDPSGAMASLRGPGVEVVGAVPEVLPWLHQARLTAVPLRWGAGVKGKVIEAMMAGVPVVGTPIAVEGMGVEPGVHALVADDADGLVDAVVRAYEDRDTWERLRREARILVERDFSLDALHAALDVAMELPAVGRNRAVRRLARR